MPIYLAILLFLSAWIGYILVYIPFFSTPVFTKNILSFAAGYILTVCAVDLLPAIYSANVVTSGAFIIVGFLLQMVLDHFSGGIEHGHVHLTTSEDNKKGAFPIGMLGGLCIHAFLEGFPLGSVDEHTLEYLIWGIVVHNIPVSIVLVGFLKHQKISNIGIIASITLFACMTPLGAYLTQYLNASFPVLVSYQPIALALVIGILMHLATTIFFESIKHHKIQISKFVISLMGVLVALIIHSQHTH